MDKRDYSRIGTQERFILNVLFNLFRQWVPVYTTLFVVGGKVSADYKKLLCITLYRHAVIFWV